MNTLLILRTVLALCVVLCAAPGGTAVQAQLQPDSLLTGWLNAQDTRAQSIAHVELTEDAVWTVSGPFGTRTTELTAQIAGIPGTRNWSRELDSVVVDGRTLSPEERRRIEHHRRRMFGPSSRPPLPGPARLARTMQPLGTTRIDTLDDTARWRIDLVAPASPHPIERLTLWFDPDTGLLVQSRMLVQRRRRAGSPFIVTTEYTERGGLDVPRRLHIEGTVQNRRRLRDFSLLVTYDATYRDYRIETGSAP